MSAERIFNHYNNEPSVMLLLIDSKVKCKNFSLSIKGFSDTAQNLLASTELDFQETLLSYFLLRQDVLRWKPKKKKQLASKRT